MACARLQPQGGDVDPLQIHLVNRVAGSGSRSRPGACEAPRRGRRHGRRCRALFYVIDPAGLLAIISLCGVARADLRRDRRRSSRNIAKRSRRCVESDGQRKGPLEGGPRSCRALASDSGRADVVVVMVVVAGDDDQPRDEQPGDQQPRGIPPLNHHRCGRMTLGRRDNFRHLVDDRKHRTAVRRTHRACLRAEAKQMKLMRIVSCSYNYSLAPICT